MLWLGLVSVSGGAARLSLLAQWHVYDEAVVWCQLTMLGHEELPVPFTFITLSAHGGQGGSGAKVGDKKGGWTEAVRTIDVSFVSATHGNIVVQLHLEVRYTSPPPAAERESRGP